MAMDSSNLQVEFTDHQRQVFCVFSGSGVTLLRTHLNSIESTRHNRELYTGSPNAGPGAHIVGDDGVPDVDADDDDDHTMTGTGPVDVPGIMAVNDNEEEVDEDEGEDESELGP